MDEQIQAAEGNPFLQPLLLIDLLIMEPILSRLLNSLSRFCHEFLVVKLPEQHKGGKKVVPVEPNKDQEAKEIRIPVAQDDRRPFVYMRHFRATYTSTASSTAWNRSSREMKSLSARESSSFQKHMHADYIYITYIYVQYTYIFLV